VRKLSTKVWLLSSCGLGQNAVRSSSMNSCMSSTLALPNNTQGSKVKFVALRLSSCTPSLYYISAMPGDGHTGSICQ